MIPKRHRLEAAAAVALLAAALALAALASAPPARAEDARGAAAREWNEWVQELPAEQRPAAHRAWGALRYDERVELRGRLRAMTPDERRGELERLVSAAPPEPPAERAARERWQALPPEERQQIQAQIGTLPGPRRRALRDRLTALPPEQRREAIEQLPRVLAMAPAERQDLRERLRRMEGLSPEQRERLRANLERWRAMTPAERDDARARWQRFQQLPPEEQQRLLQGDAVE